mgnify:CR=1 FL=1
MKFFKEPISKLIFDTLDVSDSWSMILPAVFGENIKPKKPLVHVTPDTILMEPKVSVLQSKSVQPKSVRNSLTAKNVPQTSPTLRPFTSTAPTIVFSHPVYYSSQTLSTNQLGAKTNILTYVLGNPDIQNLNLKSSL